VTELDFEAAIAAKLAPVEGTTAVKEPESKETDANANLTERLTSKLTQAQSQAELETEYEAEGRETRERLRNEQGRFVTERPEWLPPQFKTVEDYNRSYSELQSVLGRQGQELGELRKIAEKIAAQPQQANLGQLGNALEENPEAVAYWAAEQGNEQILDQAVAAWTQKALDEGDAVALRNAQRFDRDIELARMKYEFSQEVTPSIEQVRQEAGKRALALARRELATKYPDFDQVMESVSEEEVAGLDPASLGQLQKTDPKAALEMVYRWVSVGRKATTASEKEAEKAEALAAKRAATVATSSSSPATREKSNIEIFKEEILKPDAHSVHYGLTE